jgi:GATA-binding protein
MAHPPGSGGTSLAPTPTHPHHLSRESSREELEMAESLRRLNQVQDAHMSNTGSPLREQQPDIPQDDQKSEIYHSLEDAVPIAGASVSPAPSTSLSLPPRDVGGSSAPIIGQVCRYVAWLVSTLSVGSDSDPRRPLCRYGNTDRAKQL